MHCEQRFFWGNEIDQTVLSTAQRCNQTDKKKGPPCLWGGKSSMLCLLCVVQLWCANNFPFKTNEPRFLLFISSYKTDFWAGFLYTGRTVGAEVGTQASPPPSWRQNAETGGLTSHHISHICTFLNCKQAGLKFLGNGAAELAADKLQSCARRSACTDNPAQRSIIYSINGTFNNIIKIAVTSGKYDNFLTCAFSTWSSALHLCAFDSYSANLPRRLVWNTLLVFLVDWLVQ